MKERAVRALIWVFGALGVMLVIVVLFVVLCCRALKEWLGEESNEC